MSLFPEITSMNYEECIEGIRVSYKYFVNDRDVWWYCFDDIVEFIHMNENFADKLYNQLSDNEKETFDDWNNYNSYGSQCMSARRFVTSEVVRQFIERNNKRNNILIKSMNNLEFKIDANEKYFEDRELVDNIEKLHKSLHEKDYEVMANQIYEIYHSESTRELLDKYRDDFDKDIEEALDKIRDYMYKDEIKWILAETTDDEEIKLFKDGDEWNFENWLK